MAAILAAIVFGFVTVRTWLEAIHKMEIGAAIQQGSLTIPCVAKLFRAAGGVWPDGGDGALACAWAISKRLTSQLLALSMNGEMPALRSFTNG